MTAIQDLIYNRFEVNKVLVIAPKKVAESTWTKEAAKWDHLSMLKVSKVIGPLQKRIKALTTPADIYVINRENVYWIVDYYRNAWPFDMVVVDEFSSFKSREAKRFKALCWIRNLITRFVGLTGTPAPNGLIDLWSQVYLLDKGKRLHDTITAFREHYFTPDKRNRERVFSYEAKPGAEEAIYAAIGDICISLKSEDYLDLPECVTVDTHIVLDAAAQNNYDSMEKEMLLEIGDKVIDAGTAAVLTNKLLQLCNGAVYDAEHTVTEIHDNKIEAFLETVEGLNGQHALVFYNFKHDLDRLTKALKGSGLRVRELRKPEDEDAWNRGEVDIMLAHPASCAYGLNLQAGGHHCIWFGLNWSLELYQQANKRLHRQGQQERVIIHRLIVEGGMDEDVAAALERKSTTQDDLINALKARIEKYKQEE